MAYTYDLFISYPRVSGVKEWVREHFAPLLEELLALEMPRAPEIFCDFEQEVGVNWPENLREALQSTRILLPIWTPPFFRSPWCQLEWRTMLARQKLLGLGEGAHPGLVYPIVYSDGRHFDEEARRTQARVDLTNFTYPYASFRGSEKFLFFHDKMKDVASELTARIGAAPEWQPSWPIAELPPLPAFDISLPRI